MAICCDTSLSDTPWKFLWPPACQVHWHWLTHCICQAKADPKQRHRPWHSWHWHKGHDFSISGEKNLTSKRSKMIDLILSRETRNAKKRNGGVCGPLNRDKQTCSEKNTSPTWNAWHFGMVSITNPTISCWNRIKNPSPPSLQIQSSP